MTDKVNNDRFVGSVRGTPGDDAAIAAKDAEIERLRATIREGIDSGPAEQFDMEAIIAEARAGYRQS